MARMQSSSHRGPSKRGFAAMSKEQQRRIASMGGRASHGGRGRMQDEDRSYGSRREDERYSRSADDRRGEDRRTEDRRLGDRYDDRYDRSFDDRYERSASNRGRDPRRMEFSYDDDSDSDYGRGRERERDDEGRFVSDRSSQRAHGGREADDYEDDYEEKRFGRDEWDRGEDYRTAHDRSRSGSRRDDYRAYETRDYR